MTEDGYLKGRTKIRNTLTRLTLWKTQEMARKMRKARAQNRAQRLAKEFRVLKSLLLAEKSARVDGARRRPCMRKAKRPKAAPRPDALLAKDQDGR